MFLVGDEAKHIVFAHFLCFVHVSDSLRLTTERRKKEEKDMDPV